jgi:hypothetical protein
MQTGPQLNFVCLGKSRIQRGENISLLNQLPRPDFYGFDDGIFQRLHNDIGQTGNQAPTGSHDEVCLGNARPSEERNERSNENMDGDASLGGQRSTFDLVCIGQKLNRLIMRLFFLFQDHRWLVC